MAAKHRSDPHSDFGFIALSPAGPADAAVAIAGSRAGALGVLNLELTVDRDAAFAELSALAELSRGPWGVLIDDDELLAALLGAELSGLECVLLPAADEAQLPVLVEHAKAARLRVYAVATSLEQAQTAEAAGADALIAKGHEAGGWIGEEGAFVLLQRLLRAASIPVWIAGGIGLHSVAAPYVAGAAGAVLDSQLLLARESPLPEAVRTRIAAMDGSETTVLGAGIGMPLRVYNRPDLPALEALRRSESGPADAWTAEVGQRVGWDSLEERVVPLGQDAAFAADLARRFETVGGIVAGLTDALGAACASVRRESPLAEDAPLARSQGTRYPIVQGPMTRVSDRAEFAAAVAEGGALPFLALALMRGPEVDALLTDSARQLEGRPWGVGVLGFVPQELRAEQLEVIRAHRPPFALIAGGRPDQAAELEAEGITTYLHVPSPVCSSCTWPTARADSCSRAGSAAGTSVRGRASCSGTR